MSYDDGYYADPWADDTEPRIDFSRPGSALRAASRRNPRIHPCPTCGRENVLTPADVRRGYQCDHCADAAEGIGPEY